MTTPARYRPTLLDLVDRDGAQRVPRIIPIASPAAGADWSITVPPGVVWEVKAVHARLATSAVVANRAVQLTIGDSTTIYARIAPGTVEAATNTWNWSWIAGFGYFSTSLQTTALNTGFPEWPLIGGQVISSLTQNLDAGDQWAAIAVYAFERRPPLDADLAGTALQAVTPTPEV